MSARTHLGLIAAMGLLTACGEVGLPSQDDLTTTGFVRAPNISNSGAIDIGLEDDIRTRSYRSDSGRFAGYAFQTGAIENEGLFAVAGLLPSSDVSLPPVGTASYTGEYNLIEIDDIDIANDQITGQQTLRNGDLTLLADFAADTIVSAPGSTLAVNGIVTGDDIDGTVRFNGVTGALDGLVGGDRAVGAFHGEGNVGAGSDDDYMYAGGFIADRN